MKTLNTLSMHSTSSSAILWLTRAVMLSCLISAVAIFILALQQDTTLLGDPYYEDQILAHQRALIPWLATGGTIILAIVIAVVQKIKR